MSHCECWRHLTPWLHTAQLEGHVCVQLPWMAWLMHLWAMTHSYMWHDSCICVSWPIYMGQVTHSCVWHDSCICMTRIIELGRLLAEFILHTASSIICVTWLVCTCDMTHSYVHHMTHSPRIHMCDTNVVLMWRGSFAHVTWIIYMWLI